VDQDAAEITAETGLEIRSGVRVERLTGLANRLASQFGYCAADPV
jgi:hypothetical protein